MFDGIYSCNRLRWIEPNWKNPELVSVIITCHNIYGEYLERCLSSVYCQTYPNIEVILIDDNTKNIPDISKYNLKHYKVSFGNANKARNYGFKKSNGEYVVYLDADDELANISVISKFVFNMKEGISVVAGQFRQVDTSGKEIPLRFPTAFDRERLFHYNYIQTTALIKRKDFVGFDETIEQFQDWDYFVRTLNVGKQIAYLPEVVLIHYIHGSNMQGQYVTIQKKDDKIHYLTPEEYKNLYRNLLYKNMILTIATSFSGKMWCFNKYFKRLSELKFAKDKTRLVFFDDSNNTKFTKMLKNKIKKLRSRYKEVVLLSGGVLPVNYDPYPVPLHMANVYNRLRPEMIKGTHCFIWEDDEYPPKDTIERLTRYFWSDVGIASGYTKSRQYKKPLVWYYEGGLIQAYPNCKKFEEVGAVSLGCALIPSLILRHLSFKPYTETIVGHDVVFSRDVAAMGLKIIVDWTVQCLHFDKRGIVTPKIKLNLGSGWHYKLDYINIDKDKSVPKDEEWDLSQPLPYPDDSVDLIESHHLIEHIPTNLGVKDYRLQFLPILKDWHRVLRNNGRVVIECPDFDALITLYNKKPKQRDNLLKHIYGYGGSYNQYHFMGWNFTRLKTVLKDAGFHGILKRKARDYHAKQSPCLRVEAVK